MFFSQCGESLYMKYEKMNLENDKRIRTWFELQQWERELWQKLALDFMQKVADHFDDTYDPEEGDNCIQDVLCEAVKHMPTPEQNNEPSIEIEKHYINEDMIKSDSNEEIELELPNGIGCSFS